MKKFIKEKYFYFVLIIEVIMYITFLILDLNNIESSFIKYLIIILNFIFGLTYFFFILDKEKRKNKIPLLFSLLFTIFSDYFLLINRNYDLFIYGVIIFIIVQLLYLIFNIINNSLNIKEIILNIIIRIILSLITLVIVYFLFKDLFTLLNILVIIYFINLLINFLTSLSYLKRNSLNIYLSLGFFLFILCDLNVGLYNLNGSYISGILMWVFYVPSQYFLLMSIKN